VQRVAAALLDMHPAERRPFIGPLIALIERIVDIDTDSISLQASCPRGDLHAVYDDDHHSLDDAEDTGPP
jgi:hypothetical protein